MAFPKNREIDNVLLQVLVDLGGHARPQEVYPRVAEFFPQLTAEDLEARLPSNAHTKKWWNMVQWAKDRLQKSQCVDGTPSRFEGEWEIAPKGRKVLQLNPPVRPSGNLGVKHSVVQETAKSPGFFSSRTFELLAALTATPTAAFYEQHRDEFKKEVEEPMRRLFKLVQGRMPPMVLDNLETEKRILAQIRKNDYGAGGAHNYLWGAFYAKGGTRTEGAQLFVTITRDDLAVGFYVGDYGKEQRERFTRNLKTYLNALASKLEPAFLAANVRYGVRRPDVLPPGFVEPRSFTEWVNRGQEAEPSARVFLSKDEVLKLGTSDLVARVSSLFQMFFPLVFVAVKDNPMPSIEKFLNGPVDADKPQSSLRAYLEAFKKDAPAWFAKATFVRNYFEFFRAFFRREQLEKAEWPDIQKMGEHLHCFQSMALAKANALGNPNHPIEHYRKSFIYLAHGPGEPAERIRRFCDDAEYRLDYFGKSAVSELVGYLFPEQFMFVNARDKFAAEFLGINVEKQAGGDLIGELEAFSKATRPVAKLYEDIVGRQTDLPLNLEVDQFFSWLYENNEIETAKKPAQKCQYWTFSPGEDAEIWEEFQQQGIMAIGWDEMGDLRLFKSKDDMRLKLQELWPNDSDKKNDAHACWQFVHDIEPGDVIFAKQGSTQLLGYGVVGSDYDFDTTRTRYKHVRKVKWQSKGEWEMPPDSKMALKTLTNITPYADFVELIGSKVGLGAEAEAKPALVKNPDYPLAECSGETGFSAEQLNQWVRGIQRKGQAIVYGPPGTGKTFMAEKLAKHLIGGGDGFSELVQFHPAYAYEDFIQGIRPQSTNAGALTYSLVAGRFLEFCAKAERRTGTCVLIIDEINRANLARVFGELMYLLEYRTKKMTLAGGTTFQIPENVRLIGTMNTADRSIALVDHALRRRFAFIPLAPQYSVLEKYHEKTGFAAAGLIQVLKSLNSIINDKNYHVGISFFLRPDLKDEIADIWKLEIEPYLEEFFFDQQDKLEPFRWEKIQQKVLA